MLTRLAIHSAVLLACLATFGCKKTAPPDADGGSAVKAGPHATIWVGSDGRIELNGEVADLGAVDKALSELELQKGSVMYGRDAAAGEPHPNAMQVIQRVVSHRLPIRMSTKRDFSDAVGADGQSH